MREVFFGYVLFRVFDTTLYVLQLIRRRAERGTQWHRIVFDGPVTVLGCAFDLKYLPVHFHDGAGSWSLPLVGHLIACSLQYLRIQFT